MTGLRFLCFGAGAIGTYIGGSLALSGQRVVFVERPEVADALREQGLRLKLTNGTQTLHEVQIVPSLEAAVAAGPFDVAIFAVKSFDTETLLEGMQSHRDHLPVFLSLQNGVENEGRLEAFLGAGRVIPATVTSAIGRRGPGDIVLERLRGVGIAANNPLSKPVAAAMTAAGLRARLFDNAAAMKWSKMLTNLVANASSAILNMTPAEIFADPGLFQLEIRQLREIIQVMAAQGLQVVDLPGTPVRLLAFAVNRLPLALAQPLLRRAVGGGRGGKMPSFHIDLYHGRGKSEVDYLNGAVVRAGRRVNVPTPVNRVLNETLLALTAGTLAKEDFSRQPEKIINLVEAATSS